MLKVASFDIVFQEIPGEVTLALNLSNCPCHCPGCHSPHLAEDIGEPLTEELLDGLLERYGSMITCVCFMGGDLDPEEVARLAEYVKKVRGTQANAQWKTAWYSGRPGEPTNPSDQRVKGIIDVWDFVKFGPYVEALGGLKSPTTNQRLYRRVGNEWEDITALFRRHI